MRVAGLIFVHNPFQRRLFLESLLLYPLIRLVTRSRWNHVAILCEQDGEPCVIEALGGGVCRTPYAEWKVRAVRTTETVPFHADGAWLLEKIGCRYDYVTLFLWKGVKLLTKKWYGPRWEEAAKAVTCSELAAMAAGMPEPWGRTPQDVYEYVTR